MAGTKPERKPKSQEIHILKIFSKMAAVSRKIKDQGAQMAIG